MSIMEMAVYRLDSDKLNGRKISCLVLKSASKSKSKILAI